MGGSVDIRCCIKVFINLLKSVGFSGLEAEILRLAKFDDIRALQSIKRFIFELIYFVKYGCVDELCAEGFANFSDTEIHNFIFHHLLIYGFPLIRKNIGENVTSRQLLLGSLWILVSFDVLSKIEQILISSAGKMTNENFLNQNEPISTSYPLSDTSVPRLIWQLGRLRIQLKKLYHLKSETMRNFLKFSVKESNVLSPTQYRAIIYPNAARQHFQNVQESVSKLHLLLSWKDVNHTFWQWIRSILLAHHNMLAESLPNKWVSDCACELIELVTKLCDSISHFNTEYSHLFDDVKSNLYETPTLNESWSSTEDILSCIHKELLILADLLICVDFATDTQLLPCDFRYNIVSNEKELSKTAEKYGLVFSLGDECAKLKLIVDKLKTECEVIKYSLTRELQRIGSDILSSAVLLYNS
ncbi:unnamed protein product [Schistosoma turkestanicum]|nr:unnamed protein product [Schistosoma turkestanicum]